MHIERRSPGRRHHRIHGYRPIIRTARRGAPRGPKPAPPSGCRYGPPARSHRLTAPPFARATRRQPRYAGRLQSDVHARCCVVRAFGRQPGSQEEANEDECPGSNHARPLRVWRDCGMSPGLDLQSDSITEAAFLSRLAR